MNFTKSPKRSSVYAATVVLSLAATTANAICLEPAAASVNWSRCNKSGMVLDDADLRSADLFGADLRDARLRGADLRNARLI
jgi:uncharacterized protein YjbI with pentapeptide repeats